MYRDRQKWLAPVIGSREPVVLHRPLPGMGIAKRYIIAIADENRTPLDSFWMKTAYRIPNNVCACTEPGKAATSTVPIGRFNVRSFLTNIVEGATVQANSNLNLRGIAFDGGYGVSDVAISTDDGETWTEATLGENLGKYSFREWTLPVTLAAGPHVLMARATSNGGKTQPLQPLWNPAGYLRNVVEKTRVTAAA